MRDNGEEQEMERIHEFVRRHPARPRILLGLHRDGPMSPTRLSKSPIGKGIKPNVYSYHCKALARIGLVQPAPGAGTGREFCFTVTDRVCQCVIDVAALTAISGLMTTIPAALAQWLEQPYINDIQIIVEASGRSRGEAGGGDIGAPSRRPG